MPDEPRGRISRRMPGGGRREDRSLATTETRERYRIATGLRAQRYSWDQIAKQMGLTRSTVSGYQCTRPNLWREHMRNALTDLRLDVQSECIELARKDAQDDDPSIRQGALRMLLQYAAQLEGRELSISHSGSVGLGFTLLLVQGAAAEATSAGIGDGDNGHEPDEGDDA